MPEEPEAKQNVLDFFTADDNGNPKNDAPPPSDRNEDIVDEFEQDDENVKIVKKRSRYDERQFDDDYQYEQHELERADLDMWKKPV